VSAPGSDDLFFESAGRCQTPEELESSIALAGTIKALLANLGERLTDDVQPDSFSIERRPGD
jgi:hypothetical protein